jgi:hypothetical protein
LNSIDIFLFTVDISQFDRLLYEDDITNRMVESLDVFQEYYEKYSHLEWFLIFTHIDVLIYKFQKYGNVKKYFPDYEGDAKDPSQGTEFFKSKFMDISKKINKKDIPYFVINALETKDVLKVCDLLGDTIVEKKDKIIINEESVKMIKKKSVFVQPMIGDYEIIDKLGRGAFGIVFEVKKPNENERFALKTISYQNEKELKMIEKEISIMKTLDHVNVIKLHDHHKIEYFGNQTIALLVIFNNLQQDAFVVRLDLFNIFSKGGDLKTFLRKKKSNISEFERLHIAIEIMKGLEYCHSNQTMHRDLKPGKP